MRLTFSLVLHLFLGLLFTSQTCFTQSGASPFRIQWSTDGPVAVSSILSATAAMSADRSITPLTPAEINALNSRDINAVDRISAGLYSSEQSFISDVLAGGIIVSPLLFIFDSSISAEISAVAVMYLETAMFSYAFSTFAKGTARRVRPYVYGTDAPQSIKLESDARRSFFSGHATWSFSTGVFFASLFSEYHPNDDRKAYVWGGALGIAAAVSLLRVTSGEHFISDVAVGAAVGSAVGYVIPLLHRNESSDVTLLPYLSPFSAGATLSFRVQ